MQKITILLFSFNAEEIVMQLKELLPVTTVVSCAPKENAYHPVRKERPRYVLIDACLPERIIEEIHSASEEAKWDFDIQLDHVLVGQTDLRPPGVHIFPSLQEVAELIKENF